MRYKTLFRVLCKLLGVYLVVVGIGGILSTVTSVIVMVLTYPAIGVTRIPSQWWQLLSMSGSAFYLAAGAYLFFNGGRVADLAVPGNRPYCPECGYDLTGSTGKACPECGVHRQTGQPT